MNGIELFNHLFEAHEAELRALGSEPLHAKRAEALKRFQKAGFPTVRQEAWKYTSVARIERASFRLGRPTRNGVAAADLESWRLGDGFRLVFVDGHYRSDLSAAGAEGLFVGSLAEAFKAHPELIEKHLANHARSEDNPFTDLNTAFLEDGAVVVIPKGIRTRSPVEILFVSHTDQVVTHPRVLVVAAESSAATIVETYLSAGEGSHFTNAVCEILVGANAEVDYYRLQLENENAYHISAVHADLERDSRLRTHAITLGGSLTRNSLVTSLDDENIDATLNGLYMLRGGQHVDNHTQIEHRKPNCHSHEVYKGILDDKSTGVFHGRIHVFQDAQKTDAVQSNANLLLSRDATANTKPQLEIYADDVKCTHGATIGRLDDNAFFYLRARGIPAPKARSLLVEAFARAVVDEIKVPAARERISQRLAERLHGETAGA